MLWKVQSTKSMLILIGADNGLAPIRQQVIIWTKYDRVYWQMYASLDIDELTKALLQFYFQLILDEVAAIEALTGVGILRIYMTIIYLSTQWDREKIPAVFQTTFSNAFSRMKVYEFRFKFHLSLFLSVQLTITQPWFRQPTKIWTIDGSVYWRIYASLDLNELNGILQNTF